MGPPHAYEVDVQLVGTGAKRRRALSRRFTLAFALALSALALAVPGTSQASFQLGLQDPGFDQPTVQPYAGLADRAMGVIHGNTVRIFVYWAQIAPTTPRAGFNGSDPGDPQYRWGAVDSAIESAARQHLRVLLDVLDAPSWAQGPGRPNDPHIGAGAWDPSPAAFAQFVHAATSRYSGQFAGLPRVSYWEMWNEENLPTYLAAPDLVGEYRALLNAGYAAVKAVHQDDVVVLGGLPPVGTLPHHAFLPLKFAADLLCLRRVGTAFRRAKSCPDPPHFDVFAYHPYTVAATPTEHAYFYDDILVADAGKVLALEHTAERLHTVLPARRHPIWVTEWTWITNPPNSFGERPAVAARYVSYSLYELAHNGVSLVIYFTVTDVYQGTGGGLYTFGGRPKATLQALAFPFVVTHGGGRGLAWGRVPVTASSRVVVQQKVGRRWATIARVRSAADGTFSARFAATADGLYRAAVIGGPRSLEYNSAPIPARRRVVVG